MKKRCWVCVWHCAMSWGHRNTFTELMALVGETEIWRRKNQCSMDSVGLERSKRSYCQRNMEQRGFLPPLPAGTKAAWGTGWNGTLLPTFFPKESQSQLGMDLRTSAYHLSYSRAILPGQTERNKHICNKELLDGAKELPRGNGPECASRTVQSPSGPAPSHSTWSPQGAPGSRDWCQRQQQNSPGQGMLS